MPHLATGKLDSSVGNYLPSPPLSFAALAAAIALHGALLGLLMHVQVSTAKLEMPKPLMVSLLPAPVAVEPEAPVQAELLPQPAPQIPVEPKHEMEPEIKPIVELEPIPEPDPEIKPEPEPEPKPKQKPKKVKKRAPKPVKLAEEKPPTSIEPPAQPIAPPEPEPTELALAPPRPAPEPPPAAEPIYNPPRFSAAYLSNPPPAYPRLSRRMGEQGKVLLRVLVSDDGSSKKVEIESSSGSSRLDQAASEAVANWRFVPAKRGEQAIAAWVVVPIVFSLEG